MKNMENKRFRLINNVTTYTFLVDNDFFSTVTLCKASLKTISGPIEIIDGSRNITVVLPKDTVLHVKDALLFSNYRWNLISFKNILTTT